MANTLDNLPSTAAITGMYGEDWINADNAKVHDTNYASVDLRNSSITAQQIAAELGSAIIYYNGVSTPFAQTFTANFYGGSYLDRFIVNLYKTGTVTGTMKAVLYAITGTYGATAVPTGPALAESAPIDVSGGISSSSPTTFQFDLSYKVGVIQYTKYAIVLESIDLVGSGYIALQTATGGSYSGKMANKNAEGVWIPSSITSAIFSIYTSFLIPSKFLTLTNFGFAIPSGAKILSVSSTIEKRASNNSNYDNVISLFHDGNQRYTEFYDWDAAAIDSVSDDAMLYAGNGVLEMELTPEIVNSAGFGVGYSCRGCGIVYINSVTMTVYYYFVDNPTNVYAVDSSNANIDGSEDGVLEVCLSKDSGNTWTPPLSKTFDGVESILTYGAGAAELWGSTWLGADVDNTSFRLKITSSNGASKIYKDFGFVFDPAYVVTGIEVKIKGTYNSGTSQLLINSIQAAVHYGTSTLPIQAGSQVYVSNGRKAGEGAGAGTGVMAFYDGTNWKACDTGATVDD